MSSCCSIDANVTIRLLINDIPEQAQLAKRLLLESEQIEISDIALIETIFALEEYYNLPRTEISEAISALASIPKLHFNRRVFDLALNNYCEHPKLSIEDCCMVQYAIVNKALPLWTFDDKLSKQTSGAKKLS